jgi:hypothetical protein
MNTVRLIDVIALLKNHIIVILHKPFHGNDSGGAVSALSVSLHVI